MPFSAQQAFVGLGCILQDALCKIGLCLSLFCLAQFLLSCGVHVIKVTVRVCGLKMPLTLLQGTR